MLISIISPAMLLLLAKNKWHGSIRSSYEIRKQEKEATAHCPEFPIQTQICFPSSIQLERMRMFSSSTHKYSDPCGQLQFSKVKELKDQVISAQRQKT